MEAVQGRINALPEPYLAVAKATERYLMATGAIGDGDSFIAMFADFADLWERAAIDETPVRDLVGEDPAEFAETFAAAYSGTNWIDKARTRLSKAVAEAEKGNQQ